MAVRFRSYGSTYPPPAVTDMSGATPIHVIPVTLGEANRYVETIHRHNGPLLMAKFAVGIADDTGLIRGVAVAGPPINFRHSDRYTLEINRVCTDGVPNGCSMLYGACVRAAKAFGYRRLMTFTLETEPGSSLRASGWIAITRTKGTSNWHSRPGRLHHAQGIKVRWEIQIDGPSAELRWPDAITEQLPPTLDFDGVA